MKFRIDQEKRESVISLIKEELENEYDCHLGGLEVDRFLDFVIVVLAPHIHNEAIESTVKILKSYSDNLEEQLDLLKIYE